MIISMQPFIGFGEIIDFPFIIFLITFSRSLHLISDHVVRFGHPYFRFFKVLSQFFKNICVLMEQSLLSTLQRPLWQPGASES